MHFNQNGTKKAIAVLTYIMGILVATFSLVLLSFNFATHESINMEYTSLLITGVLFQEMGIRLWESSNRLFLRGISCFVLGSMAMIDALTFSLISKTLSESRSEIPYITLGILGALAIISSRKLVIKSKKTRRED